MVAACSVAARTVHVTERERIVTNANDIQQRGRDLSIVE